jgi:vacuolar-type H+-ATPase catalytic subunit A/Vma1
MRMIVYMGTEYMCTETNIIWALEYWNARKKIYPSINWVVLER